MYANGQGVAIDEKEAARLYRKACDGGNMRGCSNLGGMYANGQGLEMDEKEAARLYRKACDGGYKDACSHVD
jgi:hypothetical protein